MSVEEEKAAVELLQGSPETKRNRSQLVPVTFEAVRYTVKVKKAEKVILDGISGVMPAGRMTALMGPSGSGKTTLLDVLAGRKTSGAIEGEVLFAGQKLARGALRNLTGYVEQFDTLIGELSVKQMLMYTAELKLPPATSRADKEARVQRVITKLGLEGCADTTIGNVLQRGISGGQAKRVNIALALITQPRVLFLDEPTSGLDSHMANEVEPPVLSRVAAWLHTVAACIRWCGACTPCRPWPAPNPHPTLPRWCRACTPCWPKGGPLSAPSTRPPPR